MRFHASLGGCSEYMVLSSDIQAQDVVGNGK